MKSINPKYKPHKRSIDKKELISAVLSGDKLALAHAITLVEQGYEDHIDWIQEILDKGKRNIEQSKRIGITGPPGVGKSTFIDSYGNYLLKQGHKIAILAVDPSSSKSGGSILGDKTRMSKVGFSENCFVRPSPSSLHLGGIRPSTLLSLQLCAAAGYTYLFVESVGVGQSEIDINQVVDLMIMLVLPGSGDDIQSIKKGIIEISDFFIVHKADGDQKQLAKQRFNTMTNAIKQSLDPSKKVMQYSSLTADGIEAVHENIHHYLQTLQTSNVLKNKREAQVKIWIKREIFSQMERFIKQHPIFAEKLQSIDKTSVESEILPLNVSLDVFKRMEDLFM